MSKSHLQLINQFLEKKSLNQTQVVKIEDHFRALSNIQDEPHDRQSLIQKRQKAFDEFQQKVESEGTCVITLTPEELLPKGVVYKKSLAKQATEAVQAVNAWVQATVNWYANSSYMSSDELLKEYEVREQEEQDDQSIEPHEPVDFLDRMEQGESGYQGQVVQPTLEEESVTTASEQEEDEYLSLSTEYFDPDDVRSRSSTSSTTSTLTLASFGELDSNETVNLTLLINQACDVLRAYLMDEDKEAFEQLYQEMMQVVDDISSNAGKSDIDKSAMMERINALQNQLEPQKFNFEGQGGLNDEQVSLWFTVKFWLCSTFKAILKAVGLRSSANFFTPTLSDDERVEIGINLQHLTDTVGQFKSTLNDIYSGPDSDAESDFDSNIRLS